MKDTLLTDSKLVSDASNKLADETNNENRYSGEPKKSAPTRGSENIEKEDGTTNKAPVIEGHQSIFNDYHILNVNKGNYPIFEEQQKDFADFFAALTEVDLINRPRGASIYKSADFLYLERFGMPLNRMITLRRFPNPCFHDIFNEETQTEPDISRLITYFNNDLNTDVFKMAWNLNWKEMSAASEKAEMIGDQERGGISGMMGNIMKYADPKYGREAAMGSNRVNYDPQHDQNKVYGPVDSISKTHIRDIGLDFDYSVSLVFEYELKSIEGVNAKTAFIDLMSNILAATYNNGKFWGGSRYWTGPRPTKFLNQLKFLAPNDLNDFLYKGHTAVKGFFSNNSGKEQAVAMLKNIVMNALNLQLGKILNKVGRPGIVVTNSLLTNAPMGDWHLTVGNPLNPILAIGNLILEKTEIDIDPTELGFDDFPTKFKVTCSLKPAMPLDKSGIEQIINSGMARTYWQPETLSVQNSTKNDANTLSGLDALLSKFGNYAMGDIKRTAEASFDFMSEGVNVVNSSGNTRKPTANELSGSNIQPGFVNPSIEIQNVING